MKYFQTNSIEDLKWWFTRNDISHLINLHMIQPICISNEKTTPFALASYGTNGDYLIAQQEDILSYLKLIYQHPGHALMYETS